MSSTRTRGTPSFAVGSGSRSLQDGRSWPMFTSVPGRRQRGACPEIDGAAPLTGSRGAERRTDVAMKKKRYSFASWL
jgi:hypothetical protein